MKSFAIPWSTPSNPSTMTRGFWPDGACAAAAGANSAQMSAMTAAVRHPTPPVR